MSGDPIENYLRDTRRFRRRQMARAAAALGLGGAACIALMTRMSDIGHSV